MAIGLLRNGSGGGIKSKTIQVLFNENFGAFTYADGSKYANFLSNSFTISSIGRGGYSKRLVFSPLIDFSKFKGLSIKGTCYEYTDVSYHSAVGYIEIYDADKNLVKTLFTSGGASGSTASTSINIDLDFDYNFKGYIVFAHYAYQQYTNHYSRFNLNDFTLKG